MNTKLYASPCRRAIQWLVIPDLDPSPQMFIRVLILVAVYATQCTQVTRNRADMWSPAATFVRTQTDHSKFAISTAVRVFLTSGPPSR